MKNNSDARGLSCPETIIVIRTKNALASGEKAYTVMVDNVTARRMFPVLPCIRI